MNFGQCAREDEKTQNQRFKGVWRANMESMSVSVGNTHLLAVKQFFPSLVTDSMWTVKFDADGKVLKRRGHEGDDDGIDLKRVRITHKQADKRADLESTDDAVSKRAKL